MRCSPGGGHLQSERNVARVGQGCPAVAGWTLDAQAVAYATATGH